MRAPSIRRAALLAGTLAAIAGLPQPLAAQAGFCPQYFGTEDVGHCAYSAYEDPALTDQAIAALVRGGFFHPSEFGGVRIAYCALPPRAHGTAVDAGTVYLHAGVRGWPVRQVAALLAHEMVHVRQYRRLGSAGFLQAYRQGRVRCRCCVGAGHALEGPAFAMEGRVRRGLR